MINRINKSSTIPNEQEEDKQLQKAASFVPNEREEDKQLQKKGSFVPNEREEDKQLKKRTCLSQKRNKKTNNTKKSTNKFIIPISRMNLRTAGERFNRPFCYLSLFFTRILILIVK